MTTNPSDVSARLREHKKWKYAGDCKCGQCQLVPLDLIETAADLLDSQSKLLAEARERLQAIIDWADLALSQPGEFNSHGVKNLDGPIFGAARALLAQLPSPPKLSEPT